MSRSKVTVTGDKNEKVRHFVWELSSGARSLCGFFLGAVLGAVVSSVSSTPVGKSAHAV